VEFIGKLSFSGRDLYQFEKDFLEYLRKILLMKVGAQTEFGFSTEVLEQLTNQASQIDLPRLLKVIELFQKAENDIKWTAIQSLPLELAAVESTQMGENNAPLRGVPPIENIQKGGTTRQSDPGKDRHAADQIEPKETAARDGNDALNQVLSHWPQILDKVKDYNHSLVASLKLAEPIALEGKELILLFPYTFHKDAIDARKNRIVVDQVIEEVTGLKLMVKPVVAKDLEGKKNTITTDNDDNVGNKKNAMESALKILGGEIE
jgi:DNA polymerase-3 subunit gamma/tau